MEHHSMENCLERVEAEDENNPSGWSNKQVCHICRVHEKDPGNHWALNTGNVWHLAAEKMEFSTRHWLYGH